MTVMNEEIYSRVLGYKSAMVQARRMLANGIISGPECAKIETIIAEKYGLTSCSIFRENDFINYGLRGNMSHYKEVKT